jgi:arsenate reductase
MAEGLLRAKARDAGLDSLEVASAGSAPSQINPLAVQAMEEVGVDVSQHTSDAVEDVDPETVDWVITLCADEVCPAFLGDARRLHWPLKDPHELEDFRRARDIISDKLDAWMTEEYQRG